MLDLITGYCNADASAVPKAVICDLCHRNPQARRARSMMLRMTRRLSLREYALQLEVNTSPADNHPVILTQRSRK